MLYLLSGIPRELQKKYEIGESILVETAVISSLTVNFKNNKGEKVTADTLEFVALEAHFEPLTGPDQSLRASVLICNIFLSNFCNLFSVNNGFFRFCCGKPAYNSNDLGGSKR